MNKLTFLQSTLCNLLQNIEPNTAPIFGNMQLQQMIEHLYYSVEVAYGAIPVPAINQATVADKAQRWMLAETTTFKDNTPNPLITEELLVLKNNSISEAVEQLQVSINNFINYYTQNPEATVQNAFFGKLNFEQQVHLLHKHAWHHLRQFGVAHTPSTT
jgi:hypothetical protein